MRVQAFSSMRRGLQARRATRSVRVFAARAGQAKDGAGALRRRGLLAAPLALVPALLVNVPSAEADGETATATADMGSYEPMQALKDKDYGKSRMRYSDYEITPTGLQYKDLREGTGASPAKGDLCVVDWDGYTIGYYGRPFEARNKPKGSSFANDKEYLRFKLGTGVVIPAWEEAVQGMKAGGIRRIIVPVELGYPVNKSGVPDYHLLGPKPSTFAGERALGFVLENRGMIDKTLLFDIELIRVDRA